MGNHHITLYIIWILKIISKTDTYTYKQNSNISNIECPEMEGLYPCECKYDLEEDAMDLDCSKIANEEDLLRIFYDELHHGAFRKIEIYNSFNLTHIPEEIFEKVTFEEIHITISLITAVEPNTFINSASTLKILNLNSNFISYFPFESLMLYESLEELILYNNNISIIPSLQIPQLRILDLDSNPISKILPDAFQHLSYLEEVSLSNTGLTNIPEGLLVNNPYLRKVNLRNNPLKKIKTLTIVLKQRDAKVIDLKYSYIESLEPNAIIIDGPTSLYIDMAHTSIKSLDEIVWRPILQQNVTVNLEACDLTCECESQWIATKTQFHQLVLEAWCYDGWLPALTNQDYITRNKVNCTIRLWD